MSIKLSKQAMGALLMTLQKCLAEEKDIMDLLEDWNLKVENNEIFVENPPTSFSPAGQEDAKV